MAEPTSSISTLGESLLTQQKTRNEQNYKRSKRDAYQLALASGGVEFLNRKVQTDIESFLNQEQVMAARVKQAQGYEDARWAIDEKSKMDSQGKTSLEYFQEQMLPQYEKIGQAQLEASGMKNPNMGDYNLYMLELTRKAAEEKAAKFDELYKTATSVESPDEYAKFAVMRTNKPTSGFGMMTNIFKQAFGGKTKEQLDSEALDVISNSPAIKRAEAASSMRATFANTGDLTASIEVAKAVETGRIKEGRVVTSVKAIGEPIKLRGADGATEEIVQVFQYVDKDGLGLVDEETGDPLTYEKTVGTNYLDVPKGIQVYKEKVTAQDKDVARAAFDTLMDGASPEQIAAFQKFQERYGGVREEKGGPVKGADIDIFYMNNAAYAKALEDTIGFDSTASNSVMAQVFINRLNQTITPATEEPAWFGLTSNTVPGGVDLKKKNFSALPSSLEILDAIVVVDERQDTSFDYSLDQLGLMAGNIEADFADLNPQDQEEYLVKYKEDPKYAFMHMKNPENISLYDIVENSYYQSLPFDEQVGDVYPAETAPINPEDGGAAPVVEEAPKVNLKVLEGYTKPGEVTKRGASIFPSSVVTSKVADEARATEAADRVTKILESKDLRALDNMGMNFEIKKALESGKLSPEHVEVIKAYTEKYGTEADMGVIATALAVGAAAVGATIATTRGKGPIVETATNLVEAGIKKAGDVVDNVVPTGPPTRDTDLADTLLRVPETVQIAKDAAAASATKRLQWEELLARGTPEQAGPNADSRLVDRDDITKLFTVFQEGKDSLAGGSTEPLFDLGSDIKSLGDFTAALGLDGLGEKMASNINLGRVSPEDFRKSLTRDELLELDIFNSRSEEAVNYYKQQYKRLPSAAEVAQYITRTYGKK